MCVCARVCACVCVCVRVCVCACVCVCDLLESGGLKVEGEVVVSLNQEFVKTLQCRVPQLDQLINRREREGEGKEEGLIRQYTPQLYCVVGHFNGRKLVQKSVVNISERYPLSSQVGLGINSMYKTSKFEVYYKTRNLTAFSFVTHVCP